MTSYRYGRRLINTLDKDFDELYAKKLEERGQRRLIIQYPKRQVGMKIMGGQSSHLPLKINVSRKFPRC